MDETQTNERPERPQSEEGASHATTPPRRSETSTSAAAAIEARNADRVTHVHHHHHYYHLPERRSTPQPPRPTEAADSDTNEPPLGPPPRYDDVISEDIAEESVTRRRYSPRRRPTSWRRSPSPRQRRSYRPRYHGWTDWEPMTVLPDYQPRNTDGYRPSNIDRRSRYSDQHPEQVSEVQPNAPEQSLESRVFSRLSSIRASIRAQSERVQSLSRSNTFTVDVPPHSPVTDHSRGRYSPPIRRRSPGYPPEQNIESPPANRIVTFCYRPSPSPPRPLSSQSSLSLPPLAPSSSSSSLSSAVANSNDNFRETDDQRENSDENQLNDEINESQRNDEINENQRNVPYTLYNDDIALHVAALVTQPPPPNAHAELAADAIRTSKRLAQRAIYELVAHIKESNPEISVGEAWVVYTELMVSTGSTTDEIRNTWSWAFGDISTDHFATVFSLSTSTLVSAAREID